MGGEGQERNCGRQVRQLTLMLVLGGVLLVPGVPRNLSLYRQDSHKTGSPSDLRKSSPVGVGWEP